MCCRQCRGSVLKLMNESVEMLQTVLAFVCWRKCKCVCVTDSVGVCVLQTVYACTLLQTA